MQQLEINVNGRVQGVGFRYFVKQKAENFNIKGWVRNTSNRGVAILAEGEEKDLNTFVDWIKLGPSLSRVDKIEINRFDKITGFRSFEIRF
jgi:acylphosphatase